MCPRNTAMRPATAIVSAMSFLVGGAATFGVIRWIGKGSPELAFVVGAILGTYLGVIVHHHQKNATNCARTKVALGLVLGATAIALGVALHVAFRPFPCAEVSIPLAAVGAFVFPLVIFDTMWNALSRKKDA